MIFMYDLREDALILLDSLKSLADVLSSNGFTHIMDVYAKDGLQEALEIIESAKKNIPGEEPRLYRTGTRPHRLGCYKRLGCYMIVRDRHVAFGIMEHISEDLPLDLYSPELVAWIGHKNAKIVQENVKTVIPPFSQGSAG